MPTLTTLVNFNGANGAIPAGSLLIGDAAGDLFGTTAGGGQTGNGTVFAIANTGNGYATTAITLVSFNGSDGGDPQGGLIADSNGDLFGTTTLGDADDGGLVFEVFNTGNGYLSTPGTLLPFNSTDGSAPEGGVVNNAAGDLFGTTNRGGASADGTIYESTVGGVGVTLINFNGANGANPFGNLIIDASGDLFGTTTAGGANNDGTVFELVYSSAAGYYSIPSTLITFNGANGQSPSGGLVTDAAGDLFGTTRSGGAYGDGTVFEMPNIGTPASPSYGAIPLTLVSFNGSDGQSPLGSLLVDAAGDLFGTTFQGGANNDGTVFEIANTSGGYTSFPVTLVNFNGANGLEPAAGLIADASGNLIGTTEGGGANNDGTVFALSGSGFEEAFSADDLTTGTQSLSEGTFYTGPVAGLVDQYINTTSDNLNVTALVPNTFIRVGSSQGGSGEDAIDVSSVGGINVLDGENGSDFLKGGTGPSSFDTFFVEDGVFSGSQSNSVWSTVANFHAGDAATIWGITPNNSTLSWADNQGATGYTGLTLHVTSPGVPEASLTLSGYTTANLPTGSDPTLALNYGTESNGTPYLYIQAQS